PQLDLAQPGVPLATGGQTLPQAPQWLTLFVVFVSQPFAGLPSQFPNPAPQPATAQLELAQDGVPLAMAGQTVPQALQLFRLDVVSVSQPFAVLPSQFPNPASQPATPQVELVHPGVALATGGQTVPQAPQLFTFEVVSISQPSAALPLQSANPAK